MSNSNISSEESKKLYAERKNQVLQLLKTAADFYREDDEEKAKVFSKLFSDLENGEFSIVVVGEFSAGKSTLLNALMKNRILPSYTNETTATVNFLRHITKSPDGEAGKIFYNDGTQKIIEDASLDVITEYVSTKGDNVAEKVSHLDLYLDSDFLRDGVTLVDSPGLNGVADGHREITETQILKSHACIFLFNSDHPGSKTDFEFLNDLQNKVKTIIFVLNKIDAIKKEEGETPEKVIETLKETYKKKFPEVTSIPEIWPVAAYPALVARSDTPLEYHEKTNRTQEEKEELENSSRLSKFEDRLWSFLTCGEKTKQQLLSPVERVILLSKEKEKSYKEEKNILEKTDDSGELETEIARIQESIADIEKQISDKKNKITENIREINDKLKDAVNHQIESLRDRKIDEINKIEDIEQLEDYSISFERNFKNKVERIVRGLDEELRDDIRMLIAAQYSEHMTSIESALSDGLGEISLSVSEHVDISERIFESGLKGMKQEEDELVKQLQKLEDKAEQSGREARKADRDKKKIKMLQDKIEKLQEERKQLENMQIPGVDRWEETVEEEKEPRGITGKIKKWWRGSESITKTVYKEDRSEHDKAVQRREQGLKEIVEKIKDFTSEKEKLEVHSVYSQAVMDDHIKDESNASAKREELKEMREKHIKKTEETYKREVRLQKSNLIDYCEFIAEELETQVRKGLQDLKKEYIDIVTKMVEASLISTLNDRKHRLEQIEQQKNNSNKAARIQELSTKIIQIGEVIGQAENLKKELEAIEVNIIERENI